jgi:Peptidase family M28
MLRAYYSQGMASLPSGSGRRRPRRGSLERPVNARTYRGTWLLVAVPLLIAAFSVRKAAPLPPPTLPPAFNTLAAVELAGTLARAFPDRRPGTNGAIGAAEWFTNALRQEGFTTQSDYFSAEIPGRGRVPLRNILAVAPGRSQEAIVVMAHRDNTGVGPGANNNASGTATLVELARAYANITARSGAEGRHVSPAHSVIFLSTDGGSFGGLGAKRFATHSPYRSRVLGVVNLDSIAGRGRPSLQIAADTPRSPPASLVETAANRIREQTGKPAGHPSAVGQLLDLAFPFSLYEQAPFVGHGIPAVTLTTAGDRPVSSLTDTPGRLDRRRFSQLGRSAQALLGSLDQGLELANGTSSYIYLGPRYLPGWSIQLVLVAALLPFLVAVVDLFAFVRRRRIKLVPALRSYARRLAFWGFVGGVFGLFALLGVWPGGASVPPDPDSRAVTHWPVLGLAGLAALAGLAWLIARERLLPRRPVTTEESLAGHTAALLVLAVLALLVAAVNPFALIFILPSVHAWLWLPDLRARSAWTKALTLVAGFAGPALLLASLALRFGLGVDVFWYVPELVSLGYVPLPLVLIVLAWLAVGGQLLALTAGRYAPYPSRAERGRRGSRRAIGQRLLIRSKGRETESGEESRARAQR